jgi:formamidopyrimidine-DNA glycosylase
MPELPDLEVFSKNLQKKIGGRKIIGLRVMKKKNFQVSSGELKTKIIGQKLDKVYREGKELRFRLRNKNELGLHLMLHGKLVWFEGKNTNRHTLVEMQFEKGLGLAVTDFQSKARMSLNPPVSTVPDALSTKLTQRFLDEIADKRSGIKNLLLDQHVIRGIGNAYADEILWKAGISPFSVTSMIPKSKLKALILSIPKVLKAAIKEIGRAEPGIIGGEFRSFLNIHNANRKTSPSGAKIKTRVTGGRKTYYTDEHVLFE